MRPALLDSLFAPVTVLPGIGPQLARLIERAAGPAGRRSAVAPADRAHRPPRRADDRRAQPARLAGRDRHASRPGSSGTSRGSAAGPPGCCCSDATGTLTLVYFNVKGDQLQRLLPVGAERVVSGRVEYYGGMPQMAHPDYVVPPGRGRTRAGDRAGLSADRRPVVAHRARGRRGGAASARRTCRNGSIRHLRERRDWPGWREAIGAVHAPQSAADLDPGSPPRERLAYDEILASQLAVALVRARRRRRARPGARRHRRIAGAAPRPGSASR